MTKERMCVRISHLGRLLLILVGLLLPQAQASAGPVAPPGAFALPHGRARPEVMGLVPTFSLDFEDGEGTAVSSGDGAAMCETGACPQAHVLGRRSQTGAVAFDGVDDCLALPQSASSVLDGSFTVAAWIKGSGFDHAEQVILGDTTGHLRLSVRDKRLFMTLDGAALSSTAVRLFDHRWYHVAWRYNAETGEGTVFVDGYAANAGGDVGSAAPTSRALQVGRSGSGSYYAGVLDDISLFDRALSSSEVFVLVEGNDPMSDYDDGFRYEIDLKVRLEGDAKNIPAEHYHYVCKRLTDTLFDMTETGMRLGNVEVGNFAEPDIIWRDQIPHTTAPANGYRRPPAILMANRTDWYDYRPEAQGGPERAAAALAHQLGHYVLGLNDEGVTSPLTWPTQLGVASWPGVDVDADGTIMGKPMTTAGHVEKTMRCVERYPWWEFWNWGKCARYELDTTRVLDRNLHNRQLSVYLNYRRSTAQYRTYSRSGWRTIIQYPGHDFDHCLFPSERLYFPVLQRWAPGIQRFPEIQDDPAEAREYLKFTWYGEQTTEPSHRALTSNGAVMPNGIARLYVLDVSQAMTGEHLAEAKGALQQRIDQMGDGDTLGLITFSGNVTETQPLIDLTADNRGALKATIDTIALGGAEVATGDAITQAVAALTASGVPTDVYKTLHVIGTGETTVGTTLPTAGDHVEAMHLDLCAFNYETTPDAAYALRELAEENGGTYTRVTDQDELAGALKAAEAATSFEGIVGLKTDYVSLTADDPFSASIAVDDSLAVVDVLLGYWGEVISGTLALEQPDGETLGFDPETDCEAWGEPGEPLSICTLALDDPQPGTWYLHVEAGGASEEAPLDVVYWADGITDPDAVGFSAYVAPAKRETMVQYPEPLVMEAGLGGTYPVAGLSVTATVEAPNGEYVLLPMRDDGIEPDHIANDGAYSGYLDYWTSGDYGVTVNFDNRDGQAFYSVDGLPELGSLEHPLNRYAEAQFSVVGWKQDDHDDDYRGAPTILTTDGSPVLGRIDYDDDDPTWTDVDTFVFTPTRTSRADPAAFCDLDDLMLRVTDLGLGMDPEVWLYNADDEVLQHEAFDFMPDSSDYLSMPVTVTAEMVGQPLYVELRHWDEMAIMGVYRINVGPYQLGDPTPDLGVAVDMASADPLGESPDGSAPPPGKMAKVGLPGDVVTFTHVVSNTGVLSDLVQLHVFSYAAWPLSLQELPGASIAGSLDGSGVNVISHTVPLEPQTGVTFVVSTTVPLSPTAQLGDEETLSVFATSQTAEQWQRESFNDVIWVAETANWARLYLPIVTR